MFNFISKIKKLFSSSSSTLYVGNLIYSATSSDLRKIFSKFGDVENTRIIRDSKSKRSKGYGFVTFSSNKQASAALSMEGFSLKGRQIRVRLANSTPAKKN